MVHCDVYEQTGSLIDNMVCAHWAIALNLAIQQLQNRYAHTSSRSVISLTIDII